MISTQRNGTNGTVTTEFNDKNTFILKAQSHDVGLDGILCEKGQSNIFGLLLYSTSKHGINVPLSIFTESLYYECNTRTELLLTTI